MGRISKIYSMSKLKLRQIISIVGLILLFWLYIPALICYVSMSNPLKELLKEDLYRLRLEISLKPIVKLLYFLHSDKCFRELFYYRIGPVRAFLISWIRPSSSQFHITKSMKLGGGAYFPHPFATYIHARSIGYNFSCRNCTTIGKTEKGNPIIGNNVTIGANCVVIGNIVIGDNVVIGAGSVVVKDIPSNSVVAGVPAKIIRKQ